MSGDGLAVPPREKWIFRGLALAGVGYVPQEVILQDDIGVIVMGLWGLSISSQLNSFLVETCFIEVYYQIWLFYRFRLSL